MTFLLLVTVACTGDQQPTTDSAPAGAALPEAPFWDLEPDTGWMADYPVVNCPAPGPDDIVVPIVTYAAVSDFYQYGDSSEVSHIFSLDGYSFGDGNCSNMYDYLKELSDGDDYRWYFDLDFFDPVFVPGMAEGPRSSERFGYVDVWLSTLGPSGEMYSAGFARGRLQPWGFAGDDPYSDTCLVRVRPHRIAGAVRFELPPPGMIDEGWPEELMRGIYVWWDIRWGENVYSGTGNSCFSVFYEGGALPREAWPDMPAGWSHEDTWPP